MDERSELHAPARARGRLRVLYTAEEIRERTARLADEIRPHYEGKNPLLLGVLKGSFIFLADLARALAIPLEVDFVQLASYGDGTESSGFVRFIHDVERPLAGRHVLVVEDIVDTGTTLAFLLGTLASRQAASVRVVSLLDKPGRRVNQVQVDFAGFTVENLFVVGYGMDHAEAYRHLPDICALEEV
ncbi:MAG TPA: hypoxanthine phosphoribosyltransferase [Armatimonadetes bacterium]|nr:hypoxanthine phosphoribosyltransferase [Armatimonadota bacterium]